MPPRIQMGTNAEIIEVLLISFRWMLTTEVAEGCQRTARNVVGGLPIESEHNRKGARTQPSWRSCMNCDAQVGPAGIDPGFDLNGNVLSVNVDHFAEIGPGTQLPVFDDLAQGVFMTRAVHRLE